MDSGSVAPSPESVRLRHPAEYAATGIAILLSAWVLLAGVGPFGMRLPVSPGVSARTLMVAALFLASCGYLALLLFRRRRFPGVSSRDFDEAWIAVLIGLFAVAFVKAAFLDYVAFAPATVGLATYDLAMRDAVHGVFLESGSVGVRHSPILALLFPLQALGRTPLLLVLLHPILLALGALALDRFAKARGLAASARMGVVLAYFACAPVARELHRSFRVEAIYPLAIFLFAGAIARKRILAGVVSFVFLLAIRNPARGFGPDPSSVLLAIAFLAGVEAYARAKPRFPAAAGVALTLALVASLFVGDRSITFRAADLDAWAAAREIFRRIPEGSPVCAPLILIPHAPYTIGVSPLDRACLNDAAYAVVFTHARNAEMAAIARMLESSSRWTPEARAAGIESFKRSGR